MDPEVMKYFKKIMNSFSVGLLWLLGISMAGLYYKLALVEHGVQWYNVLFYFLFLTSLVGLLWFYYRLWKN